MDHLEAALRAITGVTAAIDLVQLARDTVAMAPKLGDGDARLAIAMYRLLAHGRPVDVAEVSRQTARSGGPRGGATSSC